MNRRQLVQGSAVLPALLLAPRKSFAAPPSDGAFGQSTVRDMARMLAGKPYEAPDEQLPGGLKDLDYDQYRSIRFLPERALWRGRKCSVRGAVLPSRLLLQEQSGHLRGRRGKGYRAQVSQGGLLLRREGPGIRGRRSRVRGLPHPRAHEPSRLLRRGLCTPRSELFPRRGQGADVRALRPRTFDRYG